MSSLFGFGLTCHPGGKFLGIKDCGQQDSENAHHENIGLDMAYQVLFLESRTVTGNPNPAVNGKYQTINQALTFSFESGSNLPTASGSSSAPCLGRNVGLVTLSIHLSPNS